MEEEQKNLGNTVRASWNWSLDSVRQCTARYEEEERDLLVALFMWCIDQRHPMAKPEAARRLGCSDNLLYRLFTGTYYDAEKKPMGPSKELIKSIREFLALEKKRYEAGSTSFVLTPTARKIITACDLARESQTPVILEGPSHIGKTWALRHVQATNNHGRTMLAELSAGSGLGGMVRTLADACGISHKSNTADLIERIQRALTPNSLLLIDEMHLLKHTYRLNSFFACVEVIRRIYDKAECGMVLCWTHLENLRNASQGELVQIWRRGVHKFRLPAMPTVGDVKAILDAAKLEFPAKDFTTTLEFKRRGKYDKLTDKPYEVLRQLGRRDGLKAITERLRYGRKLADKRGEKLAWEHFMEAHVIIEKQAAEQDTEWE